MKALYLTGLFIIFFILSCQEDENDNKVDLTYYDRAPITDTVFGVTADAETLPIDAASSSDAADDPAIWVHPEDPSKSIIYGSNKKGGISSYDLNGDELAFGEFGRINNIDIAYDIKLNDEVIDVCGGTNRTNNTLDLYKIEPETGQLTFILENPVESDVNVVYGFCFYHSQISDKNYAFLCGKDGVIEQYEILEGGEYLDLKLVDHFDIGSQPEGLVADHKHGFLYIGEENECIWKVNAEPNDKIPSRIDLSSESDNENIEYDIEGLTIYYTSSNHGYLIASIQGNNTFAIYDRFFENKYIGSFSIILDIFDGVSESDGIDVMNLNLGDDFPSGIFIAQDDRNRDAGETKPQNFKMVKWEKIAKLFDPPLMIDPYFNVRSLF